MAVILSAGVMLQSRIVPSCDPDASKSGCEESTELKARARIQSSCPERVRAWINYNDLSDLGLHDDRVLEPVHLSECKYEVFGQSMRRLGCNLPKRSII